ncbi:alpha-2A adrenergic receptor [Drosophila albomicans]|uniref:Alpha-2A adrenergic receptor n=1 Tax=Drosophila albomicans TaxID=7291 RepID=A0A6P8W932_DROAB|nr:alpha-2A adrenergic receptor [Drosophila albomicans]XP_051857982.1 alpha-2A adrenergic receptor [Drosophila albomicans]
MNDNNLQQWWENTYRRHQQLEATVDSNINIVSQGNIKTQVLHYTLLDDNSYDGGGSLEPGGHDFDYDNYGNFTITNSYGPEASGDTEHAIPSITILLLAISYGLVVFGGVVGNSTLVLTLCSASSVRLRNPLLLGVCIADLLVTGISAPVTLLNLAMNRGTRSLPLLLCKLIHFVQVMPVAASTISFFMLSLDRYATVKHPRLAQLRQRRHLHVSLAMLSWITSAVISMPFLFAYKIIAKSVIIKGSGASTSTTPNPVSISCTSELGANNMFMSFIIFHTIVVFILPGLGVLLNHYGVRRKLCALSLTARAAHGELPLPMPILRRQTHMVIVTGCANAQHAACGGVTTVDDTSNGNVEGQITVSPGDIQLHNLKPCLPGSSAALEPGSYRSNNPISPRAMREIRAHSQRQRIHRSGRGPVTPGIPLPQTSTLRSRRDLANMLVASAFIFIVCWAPHVFCIFYKNFGYKQYCSKASIYFSLLLGYFYSAISPVIYWALNNNTLRQSPCAPIIRLRSMQNFLRSRFRSNTVPPAASSTNEAALGAFNPKLIKLTPKQYRAQASSHYLY